MPHGQVREPSIVSAMTKLHYAHMPGLRISALGSDGTMRVAAIQLLTDPLQLEVLNRMHGEFSTCTAMPGNGSRIVGHQTRRKSPPTDLQSGAREVAKWGSFAVAASPRHHVESDQQYACQSQPLCTTTTTAFGWRSRLATEALTAAPVSRPMDWGGIIRPIRSAMRL